MDKREINRIKVNLLKRGVLLEDVKSIKVDASLQEMIELVSVIYKNPKISKMLQCKPTDYDKLLINKFPSIFTGQFREDILIREIMGEIRFLTTQIVLEYSKTKQFLVLRNKFESLFMNGDFEAALNTIDMCEKELGLSFWGIDGNICALSYFDVYKADMFCDKIINCCSDLSVKTYVSIGRYRFLKDVTGVYFKAQFESVFQEYDEREKNSNFKEAFKKFLVLNVDIERGLDLHDIKYLLMISNYLPFIDKYLILEKILGWLCSEAVYKNSVLTVCVYECAFFLNKKLELPFWANICNLLGDKHEIIIKEEKIVINEGIRLFCNGKNEETYNYCIRMLQRFPNSFPLINLLAKSGECQKITVPYLEVAWFIRKLYLKEGRDTEFAKIIKLCDVFERIYSFFSFGDNLGVIIENETRPIMLQGKMSYVNALISLNFTPSKLAFFLPESKRQPFIDIYKEKVGELFFCDWQISTYSEAKKIFLSNYICDETSIMLNNIKDEKYNGKDNRLNSSTDGITNNICMSFWLKRQFQFAVDNDEVLEAIEIYVKSFFISQWMVLKIDYEKINEKINRKLKSHLENYLSYCVYAYITRFELSIGEKMSETVVNSCSKIIGKHGVSAVNDVVIPESELERKKVVYFLRNVCTYDGLRRVKMRASLVQELYNERMQIIEKIIPYYEELQANEDINALKREKEEVLAKIKYLDIAKCINKGKINTSWIAFSDKAEEAIISSYSMYKNIIDNDNDNLTAYINAFAIVKKDYVQEINRILSITIRHGILEGELLRFFKKEKITTEMKYISKVNKKSIQKFYEEIYALIEILLEDYIVCTHKQESDMKLLLYVDEKILSKSFMELSDNIVGPEDIGGIYREILNNELKERLKTWSKIICDFMESEIKKYLDELYKNCEGNLKISVNKICDLLDEEMKKLKEWFSVTENQGVNYRLVTLGEVLEQEWACVNVYSNVSSDIIVTGNVINFLYTIIRELIWNAEKHSGYKEGDINFKIDIKIYIEGENIIFEVANNIKGQSQIEHIDKNVEELRDIIKKVELYDVNEINKKDIQEGKSGYHKIVKLLKRTYNNDYEIKIQSDKEEFRVKILLSLEAII